MTSDEENAGQVAELLATPGLVGALESERFRYFLDQIPVAIAVSELKTVERIVYVNPDFEKLCGLSAADVDHKPWSVLDNKFEIEKADRHLGSAIAGGTDYVGVYRMEGKSGEPAIVDAYSNLIEDDDGTAVYRLAALVNARSPDQAARTEDLEKLVREKDTQLREIQHRVKNNLQMITALIRLESRNLPDGSETLPFDRLAGRIEALHLLYASLSEDEHGHEVDLGGYLGQIASAIMRSHAREGIRLDLKVDAYVVSVNTALPAGLVVNELMMNALKHAFGDSDGTITLHCLTDDKGCRVVVADDGSGFPAGVSWPKPGKLSALIVQSLRDNAGASIEIDSKPEFGTRVTINFTKAAAAPEPMA